MTYSPLAQSYSDWLYEIALGNKNRSFRNCSYYRLIAYLFNRDYIPSMEMDENRAIDGIDLRYEFADVNHIPYAKIEYEFAECECSVLEMMLALAIKMEQHIMVDSDYGDRTGQWFWEMIVSLGLSGMNDSQFDEKKADLIFDRFDNREFSYNGKGSLFTLETPNTDMRDLDIWYQMQLWLMENDN